MSIWTDFIAINETEIIRLREVIALVEAGTLEHEVDQRRPGHD